MFYISTIQLAGRKVQLSTYDLIPENEKAEAVCGLFRDFLAGRPAEFRAKIPFLNHGDWELQFGVAEGDVAFASFFESDTPRSMGVLLSGVDARADERMTNALVSTILKPIADTAPVKRCVHTRERPLMINVLFPGAPELAPTLELLSTALASVFFRKHAR